uniref:Transposase n=1 Tax=Steinernema glaseri TaxID=37863 RepID=A0A1I8AA03_9BILA
MQRKETFKRDRDKNPVFLDVSDTTDDAELTPKATPERKRENIAAKYVQNIWVVNLNWTKAGMWRLIRNLPLARL